MAEDKKQEQQPTRREFLKGMLAGGTVAVLPPLDVWTGQSRNDEQTRNSQESAEHQVDRLPIVEAMNNPLELLDRLEQKIVEQGVQDGEHWRLFLDTFSAEHSTDPDVALRNREALDYAFSENGRDLGRRIVSALDGEISYLYPELTLEERMSTKVYGGENQTLGEVLNIIKSAEMHSRVEIGVSDGERPVAGMLAILDWVRPMSDLRDYEAEKAVYAHRAKSLNQANRLYDNTHAAWSEEGESAQSAIATIMEKQEQYFPIASAGIGAINPFEYAYHTGNNQQTEEVFISRTPMVNWVEYADPGQLEIVLTELVHEQGHQFQRDALDFDLIHVIHPEDLLEDYESRNNTLAEFRRKVADLSSGDIEPFVLDPGLGIKLSKIQRLSHPSSVNIIINEMYMVQNVLGYIDHVGDQVVSGVGMEKFFGRVGDGQGAGGRFDFNRQAEFIETLRNINPGTTVSNEAQILDNHSLLMFSTYVLLTKLSQNGELQNHPRLVESYAGIKKVVEDEVMHATMGPPGMYLRPRSSNFNFADHPRAAIDKLKNDAIQARGGSSYFTGKSVELVDFMYDQTVAKMDVQARLWGGRSAEDYPQFYEDVISNLGAGG